MRLPRLRALVLALTIGVLAAPAPAAALPRTWVASNGADGNACSRLSPCGTLARAIQAADAGGEVSALDPVELAGPVTIDKSLTLDLRRTHATIRVSGTNGITVNAGPTGRVVLRGLNITGAGQTGFNGIRVLQARTLHVVDSNIHNLARNGILVDTQISTPRVTITRSRIHDNGGNGVLVAPIPGSAVRVTLRGSELDDNMCGIAASSTGLDPSFDFGSNCGTAGFGIAAAVINAFRNSIGDSEKQGVFANGSGATVRMSANEVTGSLAAPALQAVGGGSILTYGNNFVTGNPGGNGSITGSNGGTT
jgi:Right handed beta helix region